MAYARLQSRSGEVIFEEYFDPPTGDPPQALRRKVEPGRYRLIGYQRPCDPSACSQSRPGHWGNPQLRCHTSVELRGGDYKLATMRVTDRHCTITLR